MKVKYLVLIYDIHGTHVNHSLEKWREMEKKCDFGQNCKNKALNTLTNCSKLTINHLRYLKSNSKELEQCTKKSLILKIHKKSFRV
jgi:hypothetical protein